MSLARKRRPRTARKGRPLGFNFRTLARELGVRLAPREDTARPAPDRKGVRR